MDAHGALLERMNGISKTVRQVVPLIALWQPYRMRTEVRFGVDAITINHELTDTFREDPPWAS